MVFICFSVFGKRASNNHCFYQSKEVFIYLCLHINVLLLCCDFVMTMLCCAVSVTYMNTSLVTCTRASLLLLLQKRSQLLHSLASSLPPGIYAFCLPSDCSNGGENVSVTPRGLGNLPQSTSSFFGDT